MIYEQSDICLHDWNPRIQKPKGIDYYLQIIIIENKPKGKFGNIYIPEDFSSKSTSIRGEDVI